MTDKDKTPEELAEEYTDRACMVQYDDAYQICLDAFLAGYDAGFKAALDEEDIPDIQLPKSKQPTKED